MQIGTFIRAAIDGERKIHIGQIVEIRVSVLLLRRNDDLCAILLELSVAVGIDKFLNDPRLVLGPVDAGRCRIAAGDGRGDGKPVVIRHDIVKKAEDKRKL